MKKTYRKRLFSLALTMCVTASYLPVMHAAGAEQTAKYPYAVFAADEQLGVSFTLDSLTLNGNGYTNGTFSNTAESGNMNGCISEPDQDAPVSAIAEEVFDVKTDMIYIHNKLIDTYFSGDYQSFDADYAMSDVNNNINKPIYVVGNLSVDGNLALNSAIGAVSDITLTNGNVNGNNAVLYSKFGNIRLEGDQVSVNGLIYAPFGNVIIDCADFNSNGLIIAQNVIVSGNDANINYNDSVAQFVGTETEALSWSMEDFKYLADTDSDGLPDVIEKEYKTDSFVADTDGDTLPDGYEVLTLGTNPLAVDTDANGINDNEEDLDTDNLNNGDEYLQGTDPFSDDSDGDTLIDGDEVKKYATNPLAVDSDQDGLDDPDELYFNTDPNVQDTDGNGILDGDEKRNQTFIHEAENNDSAVTKITVTMNGTGNLQKSMKIRSIMDKDYLCTNVVGLIGEPYSIETTSKFDKATLTFSVDQTKLGDTKFEDLLFLWHDEENHEFVELDTIYDAAASTVSVETTHFSKYMIVDKEKWFEAWAVKFNYNPSTEHASIPSIYYNTVLAIDCSGSMGWNDSSNDRVKAAEGFIDSMNTNDQAAIVLFDSYATTVQDLTSNKTALKNALNQVYSSGGTSFDPAISTSLSALDSYINTPHYSNRIILLSDGESGYSDTNLQTAKQKYVKIHTVGLGSSSYDIVLKNISSYTGGEFYKALTASELVDIYTDIGIGGDFDTTDTDGDGLYDAVEAAGMRLENGDIIYSDPTTKHSDTDGLEDGEEMDPTIHWKDVGSTAGYSRDKEYFFVMHSDPMKNDTDNDELSDKNDPNPRSSNNYSSFSISLNNSDKVTAIQRCLVYLGYLDMQGNDYGTCGGLTIAAIQLFQLNHRMYSDGDSLYSVDDVNYIDTNSYYSIFKEALDNGFSNCPSWVLDIVREPYFPDSYVPITLPLEEFNASLNPSNPCIISSVLRESIDTANKYNDLVDIYIYDYTPVMDRMLQSGAATFHAHHFDCNCTNSTLDPHIYTISYSNSGNVCGYNGSDYIWLISVVKDDAAYDIKRKARWNDFMDGLNANVPFYHSAFPYAFRGQVINAEIMGNILFGFAGNAGGYSKWEFTTGGSIYSYITTGAADNSEDTYYIEYGFDLFDDYADDYNYLHF